MPAPDLISVDIPLETFGGRVTQFDPQTLPPGASPINQDCVFSDLDTGGKGNVATVSTRPGIIPFYSVAFPSNPTVNYIAPFEDSLGTMHLITLDSLGIMRDESPCNTPPAAGVPPTIGNCAPGSFGVSDALEGREWIALGQGGFGFDLPRQYDGQSGHFYRVSQTGPGIAPLVADISFAITSIARAATTGIITLTVKSPFATNPFVAGNLITIDSVNGDSTLNGTFPIATVATSGGGTTTTITCWGSAAQYPITNIVRDALGNCVATVGGVNNVQVGDHLIIVNSSNPSFDEAVTSTVVSGQSVSYVSAVAVAGQSFGGTLFDRNLVAPVVVAGVIISQAVLVLGAGQQAYLVLQGNYSSSVQAGQSVVIAGNTWGTINSTYTVASVVFIDSQATATALFNQTFPSAGVFEKTVSFGIGNTYLVVNLPSVTITNTGTGGTLTPAIIASTPAASGSAGPSGGIGQGLHQLSVSFVTQEGYITRPAAWTSWFSGGGFQAAVSSIPTGPSNIVQRIIICTPVLVPPATTGPFFYFDGPVPTPSAGTYPTMVINDNTTTSWVINFDETSLQNSTNVTYLYNLQVLGEASSVLAYSSRIFWAGVRNSLTNLVNMDFDGGYSPATGTGGSDVPYGWTSDPTNGAGGSVTNGYYLTGWTVTGDGATNKRGMIGQGAFSDFLSVPIIQAATAYSVRARLSRNNVSPNGNFAFQLYSPSMGSLGTFEVACSDVQDSEFLEFSGPICNPLASVPSDIQLLVYGIGTWNAGQTGSFDCIELFPTLQPILRTRLISSYALDPESYDVQTGFIDVNPGDGQDTLAMFQLLDNFMYIVKDGSMYGTKDDGQNEPNRWSLNLVSDKVGTPSNRGVAVGESWAIIASQNGVYIFWGSEPVKISQEIQPDWDEINWAYGYTIYVIVDTQHKRVIIGAPVNGSTIPNREYVMDYSQLANSEGAASAEDIVSHPQCYYSSFQPTKLVAPGKARKWTLWNISANCAANTYRSDNSYHLLRGNNAGNGKVYDQLGSVLNDDGAIIDFQYMTYFFPDNDQEQGLQLKSHRKMCKYLTAFVQGSGNLKMTAYAQDGNSGVDLAGYLLQDTPMWDSEMNVNFVSERMAIYFYTQDLDDYVKISKLCLTLQPDVSTPVRGVN